MPRLYDKINPNQYAILDLPFFEGAGTRVHDLSRQHNNGNFVAGHLPTWVQLASGLWVLQFDGIDDYINCGISINPAAFSVVAWAYIDDYSHNYNQIVEHLYPGGASNDKGFRLSHRVEDGAGRIGFGVCDNTGVERRLSVAAPAATWIMWTGTFNLSYVMTFFKDGAFVSTQTLTGYKDYPGGSTMLGSAYNGGAWFWDGTIGEVRIYNKALTADEIQNIYLATKWRYV